MRSPSTTDVKTPPELADFATTPSPPRRHCDQPRCCISAYVTTRNRLPWAALGKPFAECN